MPNSFFQHFRDDKDQGRAAKTSAKQQIEHRIANGRQWHDMKHHRTLFCAAEKESPYRVASAALKANESTSATRYKKKRRDQKSGGFSTTSAYFQTSPGNAEQPFI